MKRIISFVIRIAALWPVVVTGSPKEWEVPLSGNPGGWDNIPAFYRAVEASNGDFLIAGMSHYDEYVLRIDRLGRTKWLGHATHKGERVSLMLGLFESSLGAVAFWNCCGDLATNAVRYDDTGGVASRIQIAYPRGRFDADDGAQVFFISSDLKRRSGQNIFMVAESRSLAGGIDWKSDLAMGRVDEVVGIHALGDGRSIAAFDRTGPLSGDTLKFWMLDEEGMPVWTKNLPTGRKADGYPDNHSIIWGGIAHDRDGRIVFAGKVENLPVQDEPNPDSIALAALGSGGDLLWLKRFPLVEGRASGFRGMLELNEVSVTADGKIRTIARQQGDCGCWITNEVSWAGESSKSSISPMPGNGSSPYGAIPLPRGTYLGFGAFEESQSHSGPYIDSVLHPTVLSIPSLFPSGQKGNLEWDKTGFPEYADTVWSRVVRDSQGMHFDQSPAAGFTFVIPTSDGGALAGGRLWKRSGPDTLLIAAVKIPPAFANGIRLPRWGQARNQVGAGSRGMLDARGRTGGRRIGPSFASPIRPLK
jgi:hypothetical protein